MQLKPARNSEFCPGSDYSEHVYTDGMKFIFHSLLCFDLQAGIVCHSIPARVVYITYSYFPAGSCGKKMSYQKQRPAFQVLQMQHVLPGERQLTVRGFGCQMLMSALWSLAHLCLTQH